MARPALPALKTVTFVRIAKKTSYGVPKKVFANSSGISVVEVAPHPKDPCWILSIRDAIPVLQETAGAKRNRDVTILTSSPAIRIALFGE